MIIDRIEDYATLASSRYSQLNENGHVGIRVRRCVGKEVLQFHYF